MKFKDLKQFPTFSFRANTPQVGDWVRAKKDHEGIGAPGHSILTKDRLYKIDEIIGQSIKYYEIKCNNGMKIELYATRFYDEPYPAPKENNE